MLLVHPGGPFWAKKDAGAWSIPKGEHDSDEEPEACARREFREELGVSAPGALAEGIDVYFDNVGGPQLEAAIGAIRRGGRIALCGAVSQYNATEPAPGPRNLGLMVGKRVNMRGFIVSDHDARAGEFQEEVGGLVASGRLKLAETIVDGGLEAAPGAFIDMLRGRYLGKVVVAL